MDRLTNQRRNEEEYKPIILFDEKQAEFISNIKKEQLEQSMNEPLKIVESNAEMIWRVFPFYKLLSNMDEVILKLRGKDKDKPIPTSGGLTVYNYLIMNNFILLLLNEQKDLMVASGVSAESVFLKAAGKTSESKTRWEALTKAQLRGKIVFEICLAAQIIFEPESELVNWSYLFTINRSQQQQLIDYFKGQAAEASEPTPFRKIFAENRKRENGSEAEDSSSPMIAKKTGSARTRGKAIFSSQS